MSDVKFDEENYTSNSYPTGNREVKGFAGLLIKTGIVKDEKWANIVLIVIALISFVTSLIIFWPKDGPRSLSDGEIKQNREK